MVSVNGIVNGIEDYVKPEDPDFGVWNFFCASWVLENTSRIAGAYISPSFTNLADSVKSTRNFSKFLAPLSIGNNIVRGNYAKATAFLAQSVDAVELFAKSTAYTTKIAPAIKGTFLDTKEAKAAFNYALESASVAGTLGWLYVDYQSVPSLEEVKKLSSRVVKDLTQLAQSDFNKIDPKLKSDLAHDLVDACNAVINTTMFFFDVLETLGIASGFPIFGWRIPKPSLPGVASNTLLMMVGLANITSHIASKYVETPEWEAPLRKALDASFAGEDVKLDDVLRHEDMEKAFAKAKKNLEEREDDLEYRLHCDQVQKLLEKAVKARLMDEIRKNPEKEAEILSGNHECIAKIKTGMDKFVVAYAQKAVQTDQFEKSLRPTKEQHVTQLISLQLGSVFQSVVDDLKEKGVPKINKTIPEKFGNTCATVSKVKQMAKVVMFVFSVAGEKIGLAYFADVAKDMDKSTKPMSMFHIPTKIVRPLLKIDWSDLTKDIRSNVVNVSSAAQTFLFDGLKIVKWVMESVGFDGNGAEIAIVSNVQNLWAAFALVGIVNDTYILLYGEDVEKNGAKLHKAGVLDDWYAGKEFSEIATNDRIFKLMGIVGSLGLATITGHGAIIGTYKPSKTMLLGLQILIFGPDLVRDLRKDILNPKAVA